MERKGKLGEPSCVLCSTTFYFKDPTCPYGVKCPLLLQCGHSACEGCLKTMSRGSIGSNSVKCTICSKVSVATKFRTPDELREEFPLNIYAVGQVALKRSARGKTAESVIGFFSPKKKPISTVLCCECSSVPADCSCNQCQAKYCGVCFSKIHSVGIALRKHEKVRLGEEEKKVICEDVMCQEHAGEICKLYCKDCGTYGCKQCIFNNHLEHQCLDICQKNDELKPEFTEAYNEANAVLQHMYASRKKIKNSDTLLQDEECARVEKEIAIHYSHLHGLLQKQEEDLKKEIRMAKEKTFKSLENIADDLNNNIKELEILLKLSKDAMEASNMKEIPLFHLLDKLKNVTGTPCLLVLNNSADSSKFKFYVHDGVSEMLQGHCAVTVPSNSVYELKSKFELPEYFEAEIPSYVTESNSPDESVLSTFKETHKNPLLPTPLPQTEVKTKTPFKDILRMNKTSLQQSNVQARTSSTSSQDSIIESACNVTPLCEGTTEVVRMSHYVSPNCFYVHRKCCFNQVEKLREYFTKHANIKRNSPETIEEGEVYLVNYSGDKKWYRGRVNKITGNRCEVFYVDYGNTETVHVDKLRDIPKKYRTIPDQVLYCGLANCVPIDGKWNEEVFKHITAMIENVELSMYIEKINQETGFHEVIMKDIDDVNSLNDALVFLGHAVRTESFAKQGGIFKHHKKSYFKDVAVKKGETFDANITHINSPSSFYVQRVFDGGELLVKLMTDLTNTYSRLGPHEKFVYSPSIGLPVAVKFTDDKWYRGEIIAMPEPRVLKVKYVDYGNTQVVPWTDVRQLDSKFLRIGIQGLKCALSDVAPKNPKGWTSYSKEIFERIAQKHKLVRVFVDDVLSSHLIIVLYESLPLKDVCINGLLVAKGHARSVGPSSVCSEYTRWRGEAKNETDSMSGCSSVIKSESSKYDKQTSIPSSRASIKSSETNVTNDETVDGADRIKINILKFISPDELYVTSESLTKQITRLTAEMTNYYSNVENREEKKTWKVGDTCGVLKKSDSKWYRGLVCEISGISYKVYIKDIVEVVNVSVSELTVLHDQFMQVPDGSYKCHLSGLLPPGGGKSWPLSSIDHFKSLISEYTHLYINKMGEPVDGSLPILLWGKNIIVGKALIPDREEWKDINQSVIDVGLALPVRKSKTPAVPSEDKFNETQNDILEWLHNSFEEDKSVFSSRRGKNPLSRTFMTYLPKEIITPAINVSDDWKPALPFEKLEFLANPTYVDHECGIYIQDKAKSESNLELIEKALFNIFENSTPKPHDLHWSKGQICIALYDVNQKWYRGRVIEVTDDIVEVLFVDYGNTEKLEPKQLRKQISMDHIPIQCHRCVTEGIIPISPDGKWPEKALDFVHSCIVEKPCQVSLQLSAKNDLEYVVKTMLAPGGQDLFEILSSMHYATYVIDCNTVGTEDVEEVVEETDTEHAFQRAFNNSFNGYQETKLGSTDNLSEISIGNPIVPETQKPPIMDWFDMTEESQEGPDKQLQYKELVLPDSMVEFSVEVPVICSHNSLKVKITHCDDPEVMAGIGEFFELEGLIQEEAESLPILTCPVKGTLCVGCYTEDDNWYRAIILDVLHNDKVKVLYVDYGNEECIPLERLRVIKPEWTYTPKQCFKVFLHNVHEGKNYSSARCHNMFSNCFLFPPYTMAIESRHPLLEVELYNSEGELAYKPLLDEGILFKSE